MTVEGVGVTVALESGTAPEVDAAPKLGLTRGMDEAPLKRRRVAAAPRLQYRQA